MKKTQQTDVNEQAILHCLSENYGIEGSISRLPGENQNYLVTSTDKACSVLKIVDDDMPVQIVEMENAAIEYAISHGFPYHLPQTLKNKNNKIETGIILRNNASYRARLITFLNGIQLDSMSDISQKCRKNVGKVLAEFDLAMKEFDHPAATRNHRWNLAAVNQHRSKLSLFDDPGQHKLLTWAFDKWTNGAQRQLSALPHQFIHGDGHGENILMLGDEVIGLIDFGDCCVNPTICELGVCLPYVMMGQDRPFEVAGDVVAGYHARRPISEQEFVVLVPLICGRLANTISVAEERRLVDPDHPHWFDGQAAAWDLLQLLSEHESAAYEFVLL